MYLESKEDIHDISVHPTDPKKLLGTSLDEGCFDDVSIEDTFCRRRYVSCWHISIATKKKKTMWRNYS